jgi:HEAT repeat protein
MPREQLLGLAADVDRLLSAGATAASGNDGLRRRAKALKELAGKVPALAPVAEAVARVSEAAPKQIGPTFLDLLVLVRQVRASLSGVGTEGQAEPLPQSGPWQTPLPTSDFYAIAEALTKSGSGREETLTDAVKRKVLGDLRLFAPLFDALEGNFAAVADIVAKDGLPALGKTALPRLLADLNLTGKGADARRLQAICLIDPNTGADLCRRALKEGNMPVRVQALFCLIDVGKPGEAEQVALDFANDKLGQLSLNGIVALGRCTSQAALDCLIGRLLDPKIESSPNSHLVEHALIDFPNPDATPRLLKELATILATLPAPAAKPKKGGKKAATGADKPRRDALGRISRLLAVLSHRKDEHRAAVAKAIIPLARHPEDDVRAKAYAALGKLGPVTKDVVPALIAGINDPAKEVHAAALEALKEIPVDQRGAAVPDLLKVLMKGKLDEDPAYDAIQSLVGLPERHDKAILEYLRGALRTEKRWYVLWSMEEVIKEMGPRACPLTGDLLNNLKTWVIYWDCEELFIKIDPEGKTAIPGLTALLGDRKAAVRGNALQALGSYGGRAKAAVPTIMKLLKDKNAQVKERVANALQLIQADS